MQTVNESRGSAHFAEFHGSVTLLLPAFANGTLDSTEQQILARHLAQCPDCYRELAAITDIREAMCASDSGISPDTEASLKKLMNLIHRQQSEAKPFRRFIDALRDQFDASSSQFYLRGAFVLQLLFIAVLSFAWLDAGNKIKSGYHTLSDPASAVTDAGEAALLSAGLIFDGNTSIVAVQDVLAEVDGKIIDGPNSMGMFRIATPAGEAKTRDWIRRLRESRKVVFAEITDSQKL